MGYTAGDLQRRADDLACHLETSGKMTVTDIARALHCFALGERERCAKIAESQGDTWSHSRDAVQCAQEAAVDDKCIEIAEMIRKGATQ